MSVLDVFGQNLRILTQTRGTQAAVAEALGIGRIQFQRLLRSEAFPKPNLLSRICDYFDVDARVLTEPLSDDLLADMRAHRARGRFPLSHRREWLSAMSYIAPSQDYFSGPHVLKNGLYAVWRQAHSRKDAFVRVPLQVFEKDGVKLVRGYDHRRFYTPRIPPAQREYRGVCLRMRQGYMILLFHAAPTGIITSSFVAPTVLDAGQRDVLSGFSALGRDELPHLPRLTRIVWEHLQTSCRDLIAQSRVPVYVEPAEVPAALRTLLEAPLR